MGSEAAGRTQPPGGAAQLLPWGRQGPELRTGTLGGQLHAKKLLVHHSEQPGTAEARKEEVQAEEDRGKS